MRLARVQVSLLAAIGATCFVSIFAAQILLTVALLVFVLRIARREARLPALPIGGALLAFCVWTLLSASFSPNPVASYESAKKLILFSLVYLAADSLRDATDRLRVLDAMTLGGVALAAWALLQFYFLGFDTLVNRPRGFLGHYMTASGLAMAILVLSVARLVAGLPDLRRPQRDDWIRLLVLAAALVVLTAAKRLPLFPVEAERLFVAGLAVAAARMALSQGRWPGPATSASLASLAIPLSAWMLLLSRTRNAWVGAVVGLAALAILKAPRALLLLPVGAALVLLLRPPQVIERLTLADASSVDRFYMLQAGYDMIRDKPVFGQGPGMVGSVYPMFRWREAPNPDVSHLHDNFIQIAAERGLPCLALWLWLMTLLLLHAWRAARAEGAERRLCGAATLCVLTAVLAAGAFEYNFGDSEVLMFTLLISALPYVCDEGAATA